MLLKKSPVTYANGTHDKCLEVKLARLARGTRLGGGERRRRVGRRGLAT